MVNISHNSLIKALTVLPNRATATVVATTSHVSNSVKCAMTATTRRLAGRRPLAAEPAPHQTLHGGQWGSPVPPPTALAPALDTKPF
ncbi:hypothetical protein MLPF_2595 [Mycobacterium lepromatosis]|nr:hypothetical protein MLPF_2595 [Mycobacterium lepromatosis]